MLSPVLLSFFAITDWNAPPPHHRPPTPPLQGITLKLRYNRAGHLFEFPILLSSSPLDWPTLAGAYLLPPLLYLAGRDLVVGPLSRGIAARR